MLGAVKTRLAEPGAPGLRATVAGRALSFDNAVPEFEGPDDARSRDETLSGRDLAAGTAFAAATEARDGRTYTVWGRGAVSKFEGKEAGYALDGEVTTGLIGADLSRGELWMAGFAFGHSEGSGTCKGEECEGEIVSTQTGFYPYGRLRVEDRLLLWSALGFGAGELRLKPEGDETIKADTAVLMGAAGLQREVLAPESTRGFALSAVADARFVRSRATLPD